MQKFFNNSFTFGLNFLLAALTIIIAALGIIAIKSLFEDDNSKIISKKGRLVLSDENKMKVVNKKIEDTEQTDQHQEVFV